MKISSFEIYELGETQKDEDKSGGSAGWAAKTVILKLLTENGLVGYGESVPTLRVLPVIESLKEVARAYVGRDPENFEANQREWRMQDFYLPMSFESTTALSAFDIASWDLVGKQYGAPIYKLIGGKTRDNVRMYANGWYNDCITPEDFGTKAKKNVGAVTGALKAAKIAEANGIEMAFHNAFGTIQNAVTIQVDAAIPNFLIQESYYDFFPQWKRDLVFDQSRVERGFTTVPQKPGIGVEINEKILESHRIEGQEAFKAGVPPWPIKGTWKNI